MLRYFKFKKGSDYAVSRNGKQSNWISLQDLCVSIFVKTYLTLLTSLFCSPEKLKPWTGLNREPTPLPCIMQAIPKWWKTLDTTSPSTSDAEEVSWPWPSFGLCEWTWSWVIESPSLSINMYMGASEVGAFGSCWSEFEEGREEEELHYTRDVSLKESSQALALSPSYLHRFISFSLPLSLPHLLSTFTLRPDCWELGFDLKVSSFHSSIDCNHFQETCLTYIVELAWF